MLAIQRKHGGQDRCGHLKKNHIPNKLNYNAQHINLKEKMSPLSFIELSGESGFISKNILDWSNLGRALVNTGRYANAIVILRKAIAVSILNDDDTYHNSTINVSLGDAFAMLGNYEVALSFYKLANEDDFTLDSIAGSRINGLERFIRKKMPHSQIEEFSKSFIITDSVSFSTLGSSFAFTYWGDDSSLVFDCLVGDMGEFAPHAWHSIGIQYLQDERTTIGIEALRKYISITLKNEGKPPSESQTSYAARCLGTIGHAQIKSGDLEGALISFEGSTSLVPESIPAWESLGKIAVITKNRKTIEKVFNRLSNLDQTNDLLANLKQELIS